MFWRITKRVYKSEGPLRAIFLEPLTFSEGHVPLMRSSDKGWSNQYTLAHAIGQYFFSTVVNTKNLPVEFLSSAVTGMI